MPKVAMPLVLAKKNCCPLICMPTFNILSLGSENFLRWCLKVATDGDASVVGGLDVRLPRTLSGDHPEGVPTEDGSGCFVVNVVVDENRRGQGIGGELMRAAVSMATDWGATNAYTHVDATNTAALNLYSKYGFKEVSCVDALDSTATLGKTLLLKRPMQQVA
eukprot:evm.model.scf_182.7 EVM.evm.TU.scf_182.7   scf_182:59403-61849(+)